MRSGIKLQIKELLHMTFNLPNFNSAEKLKKLLLDTVKDNFDVLDVSYLLAKFITPYKLIDSLQFGNNFEKNCHL
jgi:hypothetical protein